MSELSLSIAMTTFNGRRFVEQQLQSLFEQRVAPDEIVIGDDGSTDGTYEYLLSVKDSAPVPMRVFKNEKRLGWKANFMEVASRCRGALVSFCDQDDVWELEKVARIKEVMTDRRVLMAFHNAFLVDADSRVIGRLYKTPGRGLSQHPPLSRDMWSPVLGFSITFRADLNDLAKYWGESSDKLRPEESAPHDEWINFLSSVLGDVAFVDEPLVNYRLHGDNSMGYRHTRFTTQDIADAFRISRRKVSDRLATTVNRTEILEHMLRDNAADRAMLELAIDAYTKHRIVNQRRLALFEARWPWTRLRNFARLLFGGSYMSSTLPVAHKEIARDLGVAVVGGRWID